MTQNTDIELQPRWVAALETWERWLVARSAAPKTRRAYLADLTQLAEWAGAHDLAPEDVDHKRLRLFAGVLSERGASKATVARKLASARSFYRHLVDRGELEASPARKLGFALTGADAQELYGASYGYAARESSGDERPRRQPVSIGTDVGAIESGDAESEIRYAESKRR